MAKKKKPKKPARKPVWIFVDAGPLSDDAIDAAADWLMGIAKERLLRAAAKKTKPEA